MTHESGGAWDRISIDVEGCARSQLRCFSGDVATARGDELLLLRVGEDRVAAEGTLIAKTTLDGQPVVVGEIVHVEAYDGALPLLIALAEGSSPGSLVSMVADLRSVRGPPRALPTRSRPLASGASRAPRRMSPA